MTLHDSQKSIVRDWMAEKKIRKDCMSCGQPHWEIGDIIAPPAAPHGGGTVLGGPTFGLVQICCQNCGYVMHFNSSLVGLEISPTAEPSAMQSMPPKVFRG